MRADHSDPHNHASTHECTHINNTHTFPQALLGMITSYFRSGAVKLKKILSHTHTQTHTHAYSFRSGAVEPKEILSHTHIHTHAYSQPHHSQEFDPERWLGAEGAVKPDLSKPTGNIPHTMNLTASSAACPMADTASKPYATRHGHAAVPSNKSMLPFR